MFKLHHVLSCICLHILDSFLGCGVWPPHIVLSCSLRVTTPLDTSRLSAYQQSSLILILVDVLWPMIIRHVALHDCILYGGFRLSS